MASGFVGLGFRVRGAGINLQASFFATADPNPRPLPLTVRCFAEASNCPYLPSSFNQIWRHVWSSQNLKTLNEARNPEPSTPNSLNTKPQIPETLNPRPRIPQTPNPKPGPPQRKNLQTDTKPDRTSQSLGHILFGYMDPFTPSPEEPLMVPLQKPSKGPPLWSPLRYYRGLNNSLYYFGGSLL